MELNREQGRVLAKKKEQYPVVFYVYIVSRTTEFRNNFIAAVNLFDKLTCARLLSSGHSTKTVTRP